MPSFDPDTPLVTEVDDETMEEEEFKGNDVEWEKLTRDFKEIFRIRDTPKIGAAILKQIVNDNVNLDTNRNPLESNREPLLHSNLLLNLSQFFY